MRTFKFIKPALLILLVVSLINCEKSQLSPMVGKWVGKFDPKNGKPTTYYSFNIKSTGKFELIDIKGKVIGSADGGVWTLTGTKFSGSYQNPQDNKKKLFVTATFNSAIKKLMNGTFGSSNNSFGPATWYMYKK